MNLKPGDKVRIKTWDAMVEEFGIDVDVDRDYIPGACWHENAEKALPEDRIITLKDRLKWDSWYIYNSAVEFVVTDEVEDKIKLDTLVDEVTVLKVTVKELVKLAEIHQEQFIILQSTLDPEA